MSNNNNYETFSYDDKIVKKFVYAMIVWGAVSFLLGLIAALQLANWRFNFGLEWITFGRLRPLHTNAAIFAFAGNTIFAGIYYSLQRLLKARMFNDTLSAIHFWGWQFIIVSAALTLPFGITTSKEYAELEWPIDILIAVVWVVFAINMFGTIARRRERHMYVAIWFYIATVVTVAVLHIFNSLAIPVSFFKSYSVYAGIQDALVQWWYGHNAVAFFLTTPFLGLMYYFVPKAVNRPVYSYRLSIIHFWGLVFIYIWAGPHHLLYTALPDWAQTLGVIFSVMLWAPSWGGMINGLLTLRGVWHLLRTDPVVKFLVGAITFYGMSTFEGPLMSIKSVSALAHYTDWIVGHAHSGALGWNGLMAFAIIYFLVPKLWKTEMWSKKLMNYHFWLALIGIVLYYTSMVVAGITQGLMWRAVDESGRLVYPDFVETVTRIVPLYGVRAFGGTMFILGFVLLVYNVYKTIRLAPKEEKEEVFRALPLSAQVEERPATGHRKYEGLSFTFTVLVVISILIGSVIEIIPTLKIHKYVPQSVEVKPYSPLELAGRDVYIKEGCYTCHSQMIRKIPSEVLRYGKESSIADSMYDHPFQWGSKRSGPDLARVGGKYPDLWHYRHMINPRAISEGSIMPVYDWLTNKRVDFKIIQKKVSVMQTLGVPYSDADVASAVDSAKAQAAQIAASIEQPEMADREIVALIAYLQSLGKQTKGE